MTRTNLTYDKAITALLVVDPYNDFISEGGKIWDHIKGVAEANNCVPNMLQVLNASREAGLRVFYALHHASLRAYPKTVRQSAVQGVRAAFLQRSGPHSGQYARAPAHGHRRKGWQSVERGPRPVQLNFAQPGQVAG